MVSADKKASTTKVETTDKPEALSSIKQQEERIARRNERKALPSIKQLEERIARRNEQNAADQALLTQLIAKRDERKVNKLSAIEQQIAKLKAEAAALAGVTEGGTVVEPEVVEA